MSKKTTGRQRAAGTLWETLLTGEHSLRVQKNIWLVTWKVLNPCGNSGCCQYGWNVWLKQWEEIKLFKKKKKVFSSGRLLRQGGVCWACEPCWERCRVKWSFSFTPTEEVDKFRKGFDSVLIWPFRQSDWSSVSWSGKTSGLKWFPCIWSGHTDDGK